MPTYVEPGLEERGGRAGTPEASEAEQNEGNAVEALYKPEPESNAGQGSNLGKIRSKIKSLGKKHGKKIWLLGAVGGGGFVIFLLIMFILGSLFLPHFFQNIVAYRFANAARSYRQVNNQLMSKKIVMDAADDTKWARITNTYRNSKKLVLLEKYRPAAIARNMEATGRLNFEYTPRKNPFARARMTAIIVNGERIPLTDQTKWGVPFSRAGNNIRLAASIDKALFKTMRGSQVTAQVLRTSVGSKILERIGYKGFYAWANKASDYKGLTPAQADRQFARDSYSRANQGPTKASPRTPASKRGTDATREAYNSVVNGQDPTDLDKIINSDTGDPPDKVMTALSTGLQETRIEAVTRGLSTATAVAIPACLIIDGSTESSKDVINERVESSQNMFLFLGNATHQQQAGEAASEAIGSYNRAVNQGGGGAKTDIMQLAAGGHPDTSTGMSPYANALGDYSVFNVIFSKLLGTDAGNLTASKINEKVLPLCDVVASVGFGLAAGVAELVVGFFTGGAEAAATRAGTAVMSRVVGEYIRNFTAQLVSKQGIRRLVTQAGTIAGATMLARMLVSNYANMYYNGLARGETLGNQIDAGGEANANEISWVMGGRPLTSQESIQTRAQSHQENAEQQNSLSMYERYFALTNAQSLVTRMGYSVMGNASHGVFGNLLHSGTQLFNPFAIFGIFTKFSPTVSAAGVTDISSHTRTVIGWAEEELNAVETQETYYDFLENERILTESGKLEEIKEKYSKCRDETMGMKFSAGWIVRHEDGTPVENQGDCSPRNLGMRNPQYGDLVFRWRIDTRVDAGLTIGTEIVEAGAPTAAAAQP